MRDGREFSIRQIGEKYVFEEKVDGRIIFHISLENKQLKMYFSDQDSSGFVSDIIRPIALILYEKKFSLMSTKAIPKKPVGRFSFSLI